jgi:hypothetical protein
MSTDLQPAHLADERDLPASVEPAHELDRASEASIAELPGTSDWAAARRHRAEQLAALAAGDRQQLEELRAGYLARLHRRSDDFEATEGLRTVELALSMTPRLEAPWDWQRHERRPRRWRR